MYDPEFDYNKASEAVDDEMGGDEDEDWGEWGDDGAEEE